MKEIYKPEMTDFLMALGIFLGGVISSRIVCELVVVLFNIYGALQIIAINTQKK